MTAAIAPHIRARLNARREYWAALRASMPLPEISDLAQAWNSGPTNRQLALEAAERSARAINNPELKAAEGKNVSR